MIDFFEYIARSRRMTLPDSQTMLSMAGVPLDVPNEEETKRLLNRDRKRPVTPINGSPQRKANRPPIGGGPKVPVA